jgi:hypothetical protein
MWKKFLLAGAASLLIVGAADAAPRVYLPFSFTMSGDVEGDGEKERDPVRGNNDPVWFQGPLTLKEFFLDDARYGAKSAASCFDSGAILVDLQLTQTRDDKAQAMLWFWGLTSDSKPILYILTLVDPEGWKFLGGVSPITDFPPINDDYYMVASEWSMQTEGKGKLKNVSCRGSNVDDADADVRIELYQP